MSIPSSAARGLSPGPLAISQAEAWRSRTAISMVSEKVVKYFAEEALRVTRQLSSLMTNAEVRDIVRNLSTEECFTLLCPHQQPLFSPICGLPQAMPQ